MSWLVVYFHVIVVAIFIVVFIGNFAPKSSSATLFPLIKRVLMHLFHDLELVFCLRQKQPLPPNGL